MCNLNDIWYILKERRDGHPTREPEVVKREGYPSGFKSESEAQSETDILNSMDPLYKYEPIPALNYYKLLEEVL